MQAQQRDIQGGVLTMPTPSSTHFAQATVLGSSDAPSSATALAPAELERAPAIHVALRASRIGILDIHLPDGRGYISQECLDVLGYGLEDWEAFRSGWVPMLHPEDVPTFLHNRQRTYSGETNHFEEEVRRMRNNGHYGWVRMVGEVVERDAEGIPTRLVATLEDVDARHRTESDLRAAQQQIQALSAHVEAHLEAERKLIASEVHDQCGQLLTVLKLELAALRGALGAGSPQAACVRRLDASVDDLVGMSRDLIARLRPPALDLGLVPALEWLAGQWTRQTGLACEFSCALDDLALPDEQATTLFRVVQESLTNAARHARATWVYIRLGVRQGQLDLRVADNGCGFDPAADHAGHYGHLGMRERALRVGARLELNSRPGAGTEVRVAMPLPTASV
jgi:signal transduction histidine kinase